MRIDERKQLIAHILGVHQTANNDTSPLAERSLWLWHRMAGQLVPLIGETAFQAFYAHAVHFTLPHCPGFTLLRACKSGDELFYKLRDDLVAMEHGIAQQCNTILLTKFTDLVASIIGEPLMVQILRSAWDAQSIQVIVTNSENDL